MDDYDHMSTNDSDGEHFTGMIAMLIKQIGIRRRVFWIQTHRLLQLTIGNIFQRMIAATVRIGRYFRFPFLTTLIPSPLLKVFSIKQQRKEVPTELGPLFSAELNSVNYDGAAVLAAPSQFVIVLISPSFQKPFFLKYLPQFIPQFQFSKQNEFFTTCVLFPESYGRCKIKLVCIMSLHYH